MKYDLRKEIEEIELELIERFKRKYPNLSETAIDILVRSLTENAINNQLMTTEQKKNALYKLMKEI